jgi:hypothetical protein
VPYQSVQEVNWTCYAFFPQFVYIFPQKLADQAAWLPSLRIDLALDGEVRQAMVDLPQRTL